MHQGISRCHTVMIIHKLPQSFSYITYISSQMLTFEWVHFTCVGSKYLGRAVKVTKFCNKWKAPGRKWQFIQALELQNNKKCTLTQSSLLLEILSF